MVAMLGGVSQLQQERRVSKEAVSSLTGKKRISFLSDAHANAVASRCKCRREQAGDERVDRGDDRHAYTVETL